MVFAAYFVFAPAAIAQDVTFQSIDHAISIEGRFVAFDGEVVTLATSGGVVSFRSDGLSCLGEACPDLTTYVPRLRIIGAGRMGDVLLPALIHVYARDTGWTVREAENVYEILEPDGEPVFRISIEISNSDVAFERFLDHRADALLSMRELRSSELQAAFDAGLDQLNRARQGRIIALDALVPVISPSSDMRSMSLTDLTQALSGQSTEFYIHLPMDRDGQLDGFEDRFMRPLGLEIASPQFVHSDDAALASAVERMDNSLTLLPFGATGNAQPLSLSGPCGLSSTAQFLTLKTEDYPLTFPMFLYLPQRARHPQVEDFLNWLRSVSAQLVIRRAGFVDLSAVPIPLADQGDRLANAILNADEEIPLAELQRMVRILSPRVRMSSTFRFEAGSTRLDGQSRSNVMQLAQAIHDGQFGGRELMFVGFSDGLGDANTNRDLSAARAEAVRRDVLAAFGGQVPENVTVEIEAFGEALPMACDDTIWGQQTNRRVELWVRDAG